MHDALGDRMKAQYENRTRFYLPRRTHTIIRIDGKAFHTLLRGAQKPYDPQFMSAMDAATVGLCENLQGVQFAYTQSDEISLLLTDFGTIETDAWFDGNIQKIVSISASIATAHFNDSGFISQTNRRLGYFDARVFTIPDPVEVYNYFVWRQDDCTRNSIQMLAQSRFSPKQLHQRNCSELLIMLKDEGIIWNEEPEDFCIGRFFERETTVKDVEYTHKGNGKVYTVKGATRHEWKKVKFPVFKFQPRWLQERIPTLPCFDG